MSRSLGTAYLVSMVHKSIDISVENGKFISFPNGPYWAVICGDTGGLWLYQVPGQWADFCYWCASIFENWIVKTNGSFSYFFIFFLCKNNRLLGVGYRISNWRVWSWLRTNAGGVLNTCKSNEKVSFGKRVEWRTGE